MLSNVLAPISAPRATEPANLFTLDAAAFTTAPTVCAFFLLNVLPTAVLILLPTADVVFFGVDNAAPNFAEAALCLSTPDANLSDTPRTKSPIPSSNR